MVAGSIPGVRSSSTSWRSSREGRHHTRPRLRAGRRHKFEEVESRRRGSGPVESRRRGSRPVEVWRLSVQRGALGRGESAV